MEGNTDAVEARPPPSRAQEGRYVHRNRPRRVIDFLFEKYELAIQQSQHQSTSSLSPLSNSLPSDASSPSSPISHPETASPPQLTSNSPQIGSSFATGQSENANIGTPGEIKASTSESASKIVEASPERSPLHPHLVECLSQPFWPRVRRDEAFSTMSNHNNLAKELTEAWASYLHVKMLIDNLELGSSESARGESNDSEENRGSIASAERVEIVGSTDEVVVAKDKANDDEAETSSNGGEGEGNGEGEEEEGDVYLFDICCGKGYTAFLLAMMHQIGKLPRLKRIYAIDKNRKMKLDHLYALDIVRFKNFDVNTNQFASWLASKSSPKRLRNSSHTSASSSSSSTSRSDVSAIVPRDSQRKGIALGVHLCGELSEQFVSLYKQNEWMVGMVLSPCCMPKRDKTHLEKAKELNMDHYSYWTMHLQRSLDQNAAADCVTSVTRETVLSQKNAYIVSYRQRFH